MFLCVGDSFVLDGLPVELIGVVGAELVDDSDVPLDAMMLMMMMVVTPKKWTAPPADSNNNVFLYSYPVNFWFEKYKRNDNHMSIQEKFEKFEHRLRPIIQFEQSLRRRN